MEGCCADEMLDFAVVVRLVVVVAVGIARCGGGKKARVGGGGQRLSSRMSAFG